MATEKIDLTDLFDKFLTTHKKTHVSINGQQTQIQCSRLWREIKKEKQNAATKSEAQKLMLQCEKAKERVNRKFFTKAATKKGRKVSYLLICHNRTNIYSPKFKLFKHCMKA